MQEKGSIAISGFNLNYEIETSEKDSELGIECGKITKLLIEYLGWALVHFENGEYVGVISRDPITLTALEQLLKLYN